MQHPPADSPLASSLDHVGGERLFVFLSIAGDDLLDGDVRSREEPHEPDQADDDVLDGHQRWQALRVKRQNLEDGRKDERQETAADRADQWDDEVQLRYQDGESAWRRKTNRATRWEMRTL